MITLITVYTIAKREVWWGVFLYCLIVFLLAATCIVISTGKRITGSRKYIARVTYQISVFFGRARLLFSLLFLFAVFSFYALQSLQTLSTRLELMPYVEAMPLF